MHYLVEGLTQVTGSRLELMFVFFLTDTSDESVKPGPLMSEHELITYLTELVRLTYLVVFILERNRRAHRPAPF